MALTGFYPGSFDPVHLGHLDIIKRAFHFVDVLVIGVGVHDGKKPLFGAAERIALLEGVVAPLVDKAGKTDKSVSIVTFSGLTVDAARQHGARIIIRGLRDATDYNYESKMDGMNAQMAPDIETVFLSASPQTCHIAANLVRQIAAMGGDVSHFVSKDVSAALTDKF